MNTQPNDERAADNSNVHNVAPASPHRPLVDAFCGSVAGMIGKVVEHPFDTIKVRLQTQTMFVDRKVLNGCEPATTPGPNRRLLFTGPKDCFTRTVKHEGLAGLYQGLPSPLIGAMLENAILFLTYHQITAFVKGASPSNSSNPNHRLSLRELSLCGALSGACVSLILTPVELIKCQLQVQNINAGLYHHPPRSKAANIGSKSTLYETKQASEVWSNRRKYTSSTLLVESLAKSPKWAVPFRSLNGLSIKWLTFTSTIRQRSIAKAKMPSAQQTSLGTLLKIVRESGFAGLYRGATWTFVRESGGGAAWFGVYEAICRWNLNRSLILETGSWNPNQERWCDDKSKLHAYHLIVAGGLAGVAFNAVCFPADVVKSIYQTRSINDLAKLEADVAAADKLRHPRLSTVPSWILKRSRTWRGLCGEIYKRAGWSGFYQGMGITLARAIPSNAVIFFTYESLSRQFQHNDK